MCEVGGVFRQDQQTSWQGIPHVLVPRYVREDAVFNDLRKRQREAFTCSNATWLLSTCLTFMFFFFFFSSAEACRWACRSLRQDLLQLRTPASIYSRANPPRTWPVHSLFFTNRRCPRNNNGGSGGLTDLRLWSRGRLSPCMLYVYKQLITNLQKLSFIISGVNPQQ